MTAKEFVENFYKEKTDYLQTCLNENANFGVSKKIKALNLSTEQKKIMTEIIGEVLTDTYLYEFKCSKLDLVENDNSNTYRFLETVT